MNLSAALEFLKPENEYMATRGDVRIARSLTTGELILLSPDTSWLYMTRSLQPWVDSGELWVPSDEDKAADDWTVTTLQQQ